MKNVKILDCTLRDGSYVNNFSFSADETYNIVKLLDSNGIKMIEVGHGIGLGASTNGFSKAIASDEEYMKSASSATNNSKWGMFCIPNIAKLSDIKKASEYGMDFIRIGIEPIKFDDSIPYIKKAQELGLIVCVNFMKSYTVSPKNFAKYVKKANEYNVDYVYIVDSAGGMLPSTLKEYILEIKKDNPNQKLGFHGHNNLGLAVANSLVAVENGVEIIDVSLMGMGRGAGNAYFEQFISVLIKSNYVVDLDPVELSKISEKFILKYMNNQYTSSIDVISGLAMFHSSYMPVIEKYAKEYDIDPRILIIEVCKIDQLNAQDELVKKIASSLNSLKNNDEKWKGHYNKYYGEEQK
jgi:4-hydroxy-2-oxovalerate aldolase